MYIPDDEPETTAVVSVLLDGVPCVSFVYDKLLVVLCSISVEEGVVPENEKS